MDGDHAQLDCMTNQETLVQLKEMAIAACKQSAARSGTEQAADLSPIFKIQHKLQKSKTLSEIPEGGHFFRDKVKGCFVTARHQGLKLPINKEKAMVDFIGCLPEILAQACTRRNIVAGFGANRMSRENGSCKFALPSFERMLSTCRQTLPTDVVELVKMNFPRLVEEALANGQVPESVFDELGFPAS